MRIHNIIVLLLTLPVYASFSQNSFNYGMAITNKNDTIRGYFKPKIESSNSIAFKREKERSYEIMKADKIKEIYIDSNRVIISRMMRNNNDSSNVFLQALVLGKISLYEGKSPFINRDRGDDFFAIEKEGKILFIPKGQISNFYKIVLGDCNNEKEKLKEYKWGYIEKIIKANECLKSDYRLYFKQHSKKIMLGFTIGYEKGSIRNLNSQFFSVDSNAINFNTPKLGFRVDLFMTNSLYFSTGLNYLNKKIPFTMDETYGSLNGVYKPSGQGIRFSWGYNILELPLLLGMEKKITNNINLQLALGVEGSAILGADRIYQLYLSSSTNEIVTFKNITYGFKYEAGIKFLVNKNQFLLFNTQYKEINNRYLYEIWSPGIKNFKGNKNFSINRLAFNLGYFIDVSKNVRF